MVKEPSPLVIEECFNCGKDCIPEYEYVTVGGGTMYFCSRLCLGNFDVNYIDDRRNG